MNTTSLAVRAVRGRTEMQVLKGALVVSFYKCFHGHKASCRLQIFNMPCIFLYLQEEGWELFFLVLRETFSPPCPVSNSLTLL